MAANSPIENNVKSEITPSVTEALDFDEDTLRAIAEVYMTEGNKEYREKEFYNAIHFYTEGIKVKCIDEELTAKLYSNRATANFCVDNFTDSLSDAKGAIELRPTFIKAIVKGASACMELNQFEEAITWCVKGLSIDQNNKKLLELKSRLSDVMCRDEGTQVKGERSHNAERPNKALKIGKLTEDGQGKAAYYKDLGIRYETKGENFKSIECLQKSLEMYQALQDRKEEGRVYNCLGAVYGKIREDGKSIECFEKELAICKETGDREGEVTCYNNLGGMYFYNCQFENAIRHLEIGLEIAKETGNIKGQKESFSNLGTFFINLHQFERGIENCKKALEIMKEIGDKQGEGKTYNHLSHTYHALGFHEESIKLSNKALEINSTIGNEKQNFDSCHTLARAYKAMGNRTKSTSYYEKAASASKSNRQTKNEGCCYNELGRVYQDMGQYEKSIEYFEKVLLIAKEEGNTKEIATCYNNIGSVYGDLGLCEKSIKNYQEALQLSEGDGDRKGKMTCVINLGVAYDNLGQYEKAIDYLEKGLEISIAIGDKSGETVACNNLGSVYTTLGQFEKAMEFLKKALDSTNKKENRAFIYASLGKIAYSQWKYNDAIKYLERSLELLKECGLEGRASVIVSSQLGICYALAPGANFEKSRYYFLESIKNHERIREDLKDEYKILVDDQNIAQHERLSWILALLQEVDAALCIAERGRARALEDLMSRKYAIQRRNDSHELKLDELRCLFTKQESIFLFVTFLMENLFWFVTKPGATIVRPDLLKGGESSTNISHDLLEELVTTIFKSSNFFQQGECEDRSLSQLYVAESSTLEEQLEEAMRHPRSKDEYGKERSDLESNLCLLHKMIISPVADLLKGQEIVICPEGHMFMIPFAALKDANGRYLAENFRIRLIPSMTTLKLIYDCPTDYHSQTGALIVGDPKVGRVKVNGNVRELPPLPEARSEAKKIAKLLGVPPLVGEQATKQEVLLRIQEASLVHIAAHADSQRGEIALAPNHSCHGIPKKEDFLLTMEDIAKVGIRAKLVVLSCCYSGCGMILRSEGVVGIARAFLGSGARSVLVSLWAVDDKATKAFMMMFYEFFLREKLSASEAIQLSMKKMRESPLYNEVIYWAPFVLIGDDVKLDL